MSVVSWLTRQNTSRVFWDSYLSRYMFRIMCSRRGFLFPHGSNIMRLWAKCGPRARVWCLFIHPWLPGGTLLAWRQVWRTSRVGGVLIPSHTARRARRINRRSRSEAERNREEPKRSEARERFSLFFGFVLFSFWCCCFWQHIHAAGGSVRFALIDRCDQQISSLSSPSSSWWGWSPGNTCCASCCSLSRCAGRRTAGRTSGSRTTTQVRPQWASAG